MDKYRLTLKPGKYILGDHELLMTQKNRKQLMQKLSSDFWLNPNSVFRIGLHSFFFTSAMYFKGSYFDSTGEYGFITMSGYVGLFPYDADFLDCLSDEVLKSCSVIEFAKEFETVKEIDGVMKIGDLVFHIRHQLDEEYE